MKQLNVLRWVGLVMVVLGCLMLAACSSLPEGKVTPTGKSGDQPGRQAQPGHSAQRGKVGYAHIYLYKLNADGSADVVNRFKGTVKRMGGNYRLNGDAASVVLKVQVPESTEVAPKIINKKTVLLDKNHKPLAQLAPMVQELQEGVPTRMLHVEMRAVRDVQQVYRDAAYLSVDWVLKDPVTGREILVRKSDIPVR